MSRIDGRKKKLICPAEILPDLPFEQTPTFGQRLRMMMVAGEISAA